MTTYSGLEELVRKTILTAIDDHQVGLQGVTLDQGLVVRLQKQITSSDRLNAGIAICRGEVLRWIRASGEDRTKLHLRARRASCS